MTKFTILSSVKLTLLLCIFCGILPISVEAQLSRPILPKSFDINLGDEGMQEIKLPNIDVNSLLQEDKERRLSNLPYRFAKPFRVRLNLNNAGQWTTLANGDRVWRLKISCRSAISVNFLYDNFYMPPGAYYHIYTPDRQQILGAFTEQNNRPSRKFATSLITATSVVLEYFEPKNVIGEGAISVYQVAHGYRSFDHIISQSKELDQESLGFSGNCQVNINCEEGDNWKAEKKSVALISLDGYAICTGTLINNTAEDCTPYFLTANHCLDGKYDAVSEPDASTMIFYWNYERPECDSYGAVPLQSSVGANVLANSGGNDANATSDFALLELIENPADAYDVYFAGWDASGQTSSSGIGIHHPGGDAKKIATHAVAPTSAEADRYWRIYWNATANGHSVTEGGSSGSALFNDSGNIIGQLYGGFLGGQPNCSDPDDDEADYGKLSYSWSNNGATDIRRCLKNWLDPIAAGTNLVLNGRRPVSCSSIGICALPAFAACGIYTTNTTDAQDIYDSYGEMSGWTGNEYIYQLTASFTGETIIELSTDETVDFGLFLLSSCGEVTPLTYADNNGVAGNETLSYITTEAQTYYIIVDAKNGLSGHFTLSIDCPSIPYACELPEIINCGETMETTNIGERNDYGSYVGLSYAYSGPEKVFEITLSEGNLKISINWADRRDDLDLFLFDNCNANTPFLASSTSASNSETINYSIVTPVHTISS